jgi:pantoate--beta-alanine ligase
VRILKRVRDLRAVLNGSRNVTLVPTMGNLHDGHLSLIRAARERGGVVVASIFVNRLQFAPQEDFATYPRTLDRDCELLSRSGCDVVFAPPEDEIYPEAQELKVHPPARLAGILEGEMRPGFFSGVCTVLLKLFNSVHPTVAIFGKKDYQQLLVIRSMVRQLMLPVKIVPAETVRAPSGLAFSSRNAYLTDPEKAEAARLHAELAKIAAAVRSGRMDWTVLESAARKELTEHGWRPDYIAIRQQNDLAAPSASQPLVVLAAARLSSARLIDNVEI